MQQLSLLTRRVVLLLHDVSVFGLVVTTVALQAPLRSVARAVELEAPDFSLTLLVAAALCALCACWRGELCSHWRARYHCEPMAAELPGGLRVHHTSSPSVLPLRGRSGELPCDTRKTQQKMIERHRARPPFFCRLASLL